MMDEIRIAIKILEHQKAMVGMSQSEEMALQALYEKADRGEGCELCSTAECMAAGTNYHCETNCDQCRFNLKDKTYCPHCGHLLRGGTV